MFVWTRGCLCSLMSDLFWLPRPSLLYTTGKVDRAAAFSMSEKVPTGILLYERRKSDSNNERWVCREQL